MIALLRAWVASAATALALGLGLALLAQTGRAAEPSPAATTAELLAHWIGAQLRLKLGEAGKSLTWLRVHVEENFGQWATCELRNE